MLHKHTVNTCYNTHVVNTWYNHANFNNKFNLLKMNITRLYSAEL